HLRGDRHRAVEQPALDGDRPLSHSRGAKPSRRQAVIDRSRRHWLTRAMSAAGTMMLGGCNQLSQTAWVPKVLALGEKASEVVSHLVTSRKSMAQEFSEADRSPRFRSNGTSNPNSAAYQALLAKGFQDYRLEVGGLVAKPAKLSLA